MSITTYHIGLFQFKGITSEETTDEPRSASRRHVVPVTLLSGQQCGQPRQFCSTGTHDGVEGLIFVSLDYIISIIGTREAVEGLISVSLDYIISVIGTREAIEALNFGKLD